MTIFEDMPRTMKLPAQIKLPSSYFKNLSIPRDFEATEND